MTTRGQTRPLELAVAAVMAWVYVVTACVAMGQTKEPQKPAPAPMLLKPQTKGGSTQAPVLRDARAGATPARKVAPTQTPAKQPARPAPVAAAVAAPAPTVPSTPRAPKPIDGMFGLNVVDAQFQYAMQANPSLHGAWMYVTYHPSSDPLVIPGRFTIRRVFDQSRTEVQKAEMDRLIRTWIPLGNYTINEQEDSSYPFSELLTEMEDRVELDPQFQGCMISGAYYGINRASFDKLDIVLRGRFADARQIDGIEQACAMLLRRNSAWLSKGLQTEKTGSMAQRPGGQAAAANNAPRYVDEDVQQRVSQLSLAVSLNARQLREVTPSGLHALELFHAGLGHFWRYQMEEAARSFRLAALEAPSQTDYLYWIMASDIALGRSDRAYQRMENLARFQRINPSEFRRVAWSLERLQGPIRLELLQLEARALGEVCRTRYLNPSLRRPMLQ